MNQEAPIELLTDKRAILWDFDGPLCSIFSNHPASQVADAVRAQFADQLADMPVEISRTTDPLEILKWVGTLGDVLRIESVERVLCSEELLAAESSEPTPFAREAVVAAHAAGLSQVIVSNNSAPAIHQYLAREQLASYFLHVIGRPFGHPELMKPAITPLQFAVKLTRIPIEQHVFIGDSITDIQVAQAVGMPVLGLANRESKVASFRRAGATAIVTTMESVASSLGAMAD